MYARVWVDISQDYLLYILTHAHYLFASYLYCLSLTSHTFTTYLYYHSNLLKLSNLKCVCLLQVLSTLAPLNSEPAARSISSSNEAEFTVQSELIEPDASQSARASECAESHPSQSQSADCSTNTRLRGEHTASVSVPVNHAAPEPVPASADALAAHSPLQSQAAAASPMVATAQLVVEQSSDAPASDGSGGDGGGDGGGGGGGDSGMKTAHGLGCSRMSSRLRQLAPTQLAQAACRPQPVRIAGLLRVYQRREHAGRTWQHLVALTTEADPASLYTASAAAAAAPPSPSSPPASPSAPRPSRAAEWLSVEEMRASSAAGDLLGIEPLDLAVLLEQTLAYSSAFIGLYSKYTSALVLCTSTLHSIRHHSEIQLHPARFRESRLDLDLHTLRVCVHLSSSGQLLLLSHPIRSDR